MPSKHPRIAVTAGPKLVVGRDRRVAAEALFEAMDSEQFDLDSKLSIASTNYTRPDVGRDLGRHRVDAGEHLCGIAAVELTLDGLLSVGLF
jgi:hypothetical protein